MEALFSQQAVSNAEAVTKTHGDTAAQVVETVNEVVTVGAAVAATVADSSKDNETKTAEVVQIGAEVVSKIPGVAAYAPVIALGVQLEPEIYHGISALIHFFQNRRKTAQTNQK